MCVCVYAHEGYVLCSVWVLAGPRTMALWQPHLCQATGFSNLQGIFYVFGFYVLLN